MSKYSFASLVREKTGTHFLDSGGDKGRHWQQPAPPAKLYIDLRARMWGKEKENVEVSATINLAEFLSHCLVIDEELTDALHESDAHWSQESAEWLIENGFAGERTMQTNDNAYNWENDLSQVFQFAVLSEREDWYYDDEALIVIQSHNGADVRGGYSRSVVCRPNGDPENALLTLTRPIVGWKILGGTDADGNELSDEECQELDERWQPGYSSSPTYEMCKELASVVECEGGSADAGGIADSLTVTLKSGETVRITPTCEAEYL